MHVEKRQITCVSIAHIIGGTLMTVCGALQGILQLKYLLLDSLYGGIWVGIWVSIHSAVYVSCSKNCTMSSS